MVFKEEITKQLRNLSDRFDLVRDSELPEGGTVAFEFIKARPEVRLKKWNGEVDLGVRYDKIASVGIQSGNRMEWKGVKEEIHAYPLEAQEGMEDGGLEIEVILSSKPVKNTFDFAIDGAENLDFFYQPQLTQVEIDE